MGAKGYVEKFVEGIDKAQEDAKIVGYGACVSRTGYPVQPTAFKWAHEIVAELSRARERFAPMRGPHEGYAVILEELDEAWDAIKANNLEHAKKEILQVAAMCLAFLTEV